MDEKRLKAELILKGMSMKNFAEHLGINSATLYRKTHNQSSFTLEELKKAKEIFDGKVMEEIFLSIKLRKRNK